MATALARHCASPGCSGKAVRDGRCEQHARQNHRDYERLRGSASSRGYTRRWQRYRLIYLRQNPLCRACRAEGRTTAATVVDHIKPVNQGGAFWDADNHQPMCEPCHNRKTQVDGSRR